jgi:DnaD/phage-associated family protein
MPRRMVTSKLFQNEKVATLDYGGRYFFVGTITNADDDGRLKGSSKYLKANIFPYDNITEEQIIKYRTTCHELGLIYYYIVNGIEIIMLPGWAEHQIIRGDRYHPSTLPPPNDNHQTTKGIPTNDNKTTTLDIKAGIPNGNQPTTDGMLNIIEYNINKSNIIKTSVGEIFKIFEANFQKITEINSNQLNDLIETYGIENVKVALVKAVKRNARNLAYVETILKPKEVNKNPVWE